MHWYFVLLNELVAMGGCYSINLEKAVRPRKTQKSRNKKTY
jgi:hypothetical protein